LCLGDDGVVNWADWFLAGRGIVIYSDVDLVKDVFCVFSEIGFESTEGVSGYIVNAM
jgi:hypothetical protein